MTRILGIDLSLNHAGLVMLNDLGRVVWYQYVTDKSTRGAKRRFANAVHMNVKKTKDRQQMNAARLWWWSQHIRHTLKEQIPDYVGIEDYAIRAQSNSAYQIGELGGLVRLSALECGAMLRTHDPLSVKMYTTLMGNAKPAEVAEHVMSRYAAPSDWRNFKEEALFDLCVAYAVARMVLDELKVRQGHLDLRDLEDKQRQVFNRITKSYPVNLLSREFIHPDIMTDV